ncbi:MAG: hypothetical protein PHG48_03505 [Eubacteriales bacterium]|nr:hypothetical protein [Eubacteriales bacterium]
MNIKDVAVFFLNEFLFTAFIITLGYVFAWVIYSRILFRNISINEVLLEKSNYAAWIEFSGAFLLPVLFLTAKATAGPASEKILFDFIVCFVYTLMYILFLLIAKYAARIFLPPVYTENGRVRYDLSTEIFSSGNTAAAFYSLTVTWIAANIIRFIDIDADYIMVSALRVSNILIYTLLGYIFFRLFIHPKTSANKVIFTDRNTAASIVMAGYLLSLQYLIGSITAFQTEFGFIQLLLITAVSFITYAVLSVLLKYLLSLIIKAGFRKEVYLQSSIPAAVAQSALYAGIAMTITAFVR